MSDLAKPKYDSHQHLMVWDIEEVGVHLTPLSGGDHVVWHHQFLYLVYKSLCFAIPIMLDAGDEVKWNYDLIGGGMKQDDFGGIQQDG